MTDANIKSVAILGGGVVGWLSAAVLTSMLGEEVSIVVLECQADKTRGCCTHATIPPLKALHQMLGIEEADLLKKTQGSFKLGTQFVNWGALGNRYFHPHGQYGAEFDAISLHHWWLKARQEDPDTPPLEALSLAAAMGSEGRFTHPVPDRRMIQSTFDYAYNLDETLYGDYLAQLAKGRGVAVMQAEISQIERDAETGFVTTICLDNDQIIEADLYLDCTGSVGQLIKGALGAQFDDWSHYLSCDRTVSVACQRGPDLYPATRITQREAGWQWLTPMQHQTSTGYVYASAYLTDEDAAANLFDNLEGRALGDPAYTSFKNGRCKTPFQKNVVALGDAAGLLEPLEATSLQMVQSGLMRLLALWPTKSCDPLLAQEYNDVTASEWELARDFLILHYKATIRTDTAFWRLCQDMAIPDGLAHRIDHWKASGRLISPRSELFQPASWLSVYVGQGVDAGGWDPLADARANRIEPKARLAGIAKVISETIAQMPLHKDVIEKQYKAPKA
jgi:tryptophan 7-halogenase